MLLNKLTSVFAVILLVIFLIAVRLFEVQLFQDPLHVYFHSTFHLYDLPEVQKWSVLASTSLRFLFNMVLSLWILWFLFKTESFIKAALWVYLFAFLILLFLFFLLLEADTSFLKMALFYIRRFLIQPILLFVMVAGFYFLKTKGNSLAS